jgi:glycosyltransferase involved in cell wall biosynthesis
VNRPSAAPGKSKKMKTVLAYMIPIDHWETYAASARRFSETYQLFPAETEHELLVMCCNGPATESVTSLFRGLRARFETYCGGGWDCGAGQEAAKITDCDFLVCANARVYLSRPGWLRRFVDARAEHGEGLYGATASYESLPYVPGEFNPHIRTSFYGCNPSTFRQFPFRIESREDCFKFESGAWNFTRWFEERGEPCLMVTWDGCYEKQHFRTAPNVFRTGDQSNLIICDGHTEMYELADVQRRTELELRANGGKLALFSCVDLPSILGAGRSEQLPGKEGLTAPAHVLSSADGLTNRVPEQPLVSTGMPVYNGERYLTQALESVLAQDYSNFEVVISDNGSRDRTEEICRQFAERDSRIRYLRHPRNQGMPWNFARVVQEAKGEYFMWAAHDDLFHPSYIRKCLDKLSAHPEAVLCCTEINFIDADGLPHSDWSKKHYTNFETLGMTTPQRIHELISRLGWFATYGLMRLENAKKISLGLNVYGYDVILIEEMLLLGDVVKVHEPLFSYRIGESKSAEEYQTNFNAEDNPLPATKTPLTDLAANLLQTVYRSPLPSGQKVEIFADFLITLSRSNPYWRDQITIELMGTETHLRDHEFALLLAVVLSRSLPLDMMKGNPLMKAMCRLPDSGTELLQAAEALRTQPGVALIGAA